MKAFIFLVLIPVLAGVVSTIFGVGWANEGQLLNAALINIPICICSVAIYHSV